MPPNPPPRRAPARRPARSGTDNDGESSTAAAAEETTQRTSASTSSNPRGGAAGSPPRPTPSGSTRPPVQRLQSLKKRAPGGTLIPPNPDGSTPKPALKYQPRAVNRRSKEEREAIERLEAERKRERLAEVAAVQNAAARGSERGRGRGRGGYGRGGVSAGGMDGPSRGPENRRRGGGLGGGGGGGSWGSGGGKIKGEYKPSGGRKVTKTSVIRGRDGADQLVTREVSSDEGDDSGPRVSIENINAVSDSEDESDGPYDRKEKGKAKGKQRAGTSTGAGKGLRPVRVERHEHVERVVAVNTEADASKSAELRRKAREAAAAAADDDDSGLFVRDDDEPTAQAEGGETQPASSEPRVKEEPTDGDVIMADNIPDARDVDPTNTRDGMPSPTADLPAELQMNTDTQNQRRNGEDDLEWDTHQMQLETLKKTLGSVDLAAKPSTDEEEGQEPKSETEPPVNPRDGRLFLIQFPPKTPNLLLPKDPTQEDVLPEAPPQPTAASPPSIGGIGIKKERSSTTDAAPTPIPTSEEKPAPYVTATSNNLPAGRVGKLNLHKSGRVTIDWGGIPFELHMGSEVDFLQDAVVTSSPSTDLTGEEAEEKKVWAMSQVTGKFVVTPDWDQLLGE